MISADCVFDHEKQNERRWSSQQRWLREMCKGTKTVEARLGNKVGNLQVLEPIVFTSGLWRVYTVVTRIRYYASFKNMLIEEGLATVLPGVKSIEQGVKIFHHMYEPSWEEKHGVCALKIKFIKSERPEAIEKPKLDRKQPPIETFCKRQKVS